MSPKAFFSPAPSWCCSPLLMAMPLLDRIVSDLPPPPRISFCTIMPKHTYDHIPLLCGSLHSWEEAQALYPELRSIRPPSCKPQAVRATANECRGLRAESGIVMEQMRRGWLCGASGVAGTAVTLEGPGWANVIDLKVLVGRSQSYIYPKVGQQVDTRLSPGTECWHGPGSNRK